VGAYISMKNGGAYVTSIILVMNLMMMIDERG
jgi:hypothetical protein